MLKHWLRILALTIALLLLWRLFSHVEGAPFGPTREAYQREGMVAFIYSLKQPGIWVPGEWAKDAEAVIWCESSFNPLAVGQAGEIGLLQILPDDKINIRVMRALGFTKQDLFNPVKNIQVGVFRWQVYGWEGWSCYKGGSDEPIMGSLQGSESDGLPPRLHALLLGD